MNKIGIHYGYWAKNWDVDYRESIRKAASLGFDVIEFDLAGFFNRTEAQLDEIIAVAKENNIEMTFCVGFGKEYDMSSDDASMRRRGIDHAIKDLKMISRMGGKTFSGITYGVWQPDVPDLTDGKEKWLTYSADSVREISKVSDELGIRYNLEIVNRFESFLLNTAEEGMAFLERVGNPNIMLLLDTFHMNIEENSFRDAILAAKGRIGHFHIGEANRKVPGKGRLPWDEIFGTLKEVGYKDRIVMEPFVRSGGEVPRAIAVWRDIVKDTSEAALDADAKFSRDFVASKIR